MVFSIIIPIKNLEEVKTDIKSLNGKVLEELTVREFEEIEESIIPFIKIVYSAKYKLYPLNTFLIDINNHFQVKQNSSY